MGVMKRLLKIRLFLVALALFSLVWMIVLEARLPFERFGFIVRGMYYEEIVLAVLLVAASLFLLNERLWSLIVASVVAGFVFYQVLIRDFLLLAENAEVPVFSNEHVRLWWPNLGEGQWLQIILSALILAGSLTVLIRRRTNPVFSRTR